MLKSRDENGVKMTTDKYTMLGLTSWRASYSTRGRKHPIENIGILQHQSILHKPQEL